MHDILGELSDADILSFRTPPQVSTASLQNQWWKKYRTRRYRWQDLIEAGKNDLYPWAPIRLTKGFFTIVLIEDYARVTTRYDGTIQKYWANLCNDPVTGEVNGFYACRRGREEDGEPSTVGLHRALLGKTMYGLGDVDHVNGEGGDNRGNEQTVVNLIYCPTRSQNNHNGVRSGTTGVEFKKNGRFGGIRSVRLKRRGVGSVKTFRSRNPDGSILDWDSPLPAREWYLNELAKLHNRDTWAHNRTSVKFAAFPPTLGQQRSMRSPTSADSCALSDTF